MKTKASLTVEATFIMPVVLFIIVFIIYLSFYLHDYCKINGLVDVTLHKASMNLKHDADIATGRVNFNEIDRSLIDRIFADSDSKEEEIEDYIRMLLSRGLLATDITEVKATKGALSLTIRVEGRFKNPFKGLQWLIPSNNLLVEAKAANHYPADSVRISDVVLDIGSKIKGFDKLKEGIGKLIPKNKGEE